MSQQGHTRYTSASMEEGRGWPDKRTTRHDQDDKTKVTASHLNSNMVAEPYLETADPRRSRRTSWMITSSNAVEVQKS